MGLLEEPLVLSDLSDLEDDGDNEKDANAFLTLIIGAFFFLSRDWVLPNS